VFTNRHSKTEDNAGQCEVTHLVQQLSRPMSLVITSYPLSLFNSVYIVTASVACLVKPV